MVKPNILLLDIETSPGKAFVWSLWDKFIPLERLIEPGRVLCAAYQWYGKKGVTFLSEWGDGRVPMLHQLKEALDEADAVVTYNGNKFDLPRLNGEFVMEGLDPPAPVTSIDLYKTVKKLGFMSGKLAYVGPLLKIGEKVDHGGFKLWSDVLQGVSEAQDRMERYNVQDVRLLSKLYRTLAPYIPTHPHLRDTKPEGCPTCGSTHVQKRGYRRSRYYRVERLHCQSCGAWSQGVRTKIK